MGAGLLIWIGAANNLTLVGRILSWRPIVWIGLISYSLYLWHWPVIVFSQQMMLEETIVLQAVTFSLMIALAWISWRYIEAPFRNRGFVSRRAVFSLTAVSTLLISLTGGVLAVNSGFKSRFPEIAEIEEWISAERALKREYSNCMEGSDGKPWAGVENCFITSGNGPRVLLWGDSHALHYHLPLHLLDDKINYNILAYGMTGCRPIFGFPAPNRPTCVENKERVIDLIRESKIERVIISGMWDDQPDLVFSNGPISVKATVERLKMLGVEVVILGDNPIFSMSTPATLFPKVSSAPDPHGTFYLNPINDINVNIELEKVVGSDNFFNPMEALCTKSGCAYYDKGKPLMADADHLSLEAAHRVIVAFPELFGYQP